MFAQSSSLVLNFRHLVLNKMEQIGQTAVTIRNIIFEIAPREYRQNAMRHLLNSCMSRLYDKQQGLQDWANVQRVL